MKELERMAREIFDQVEMCTTTHADTCDCMKVVKRMILQAYELGRKSVHDELLEKYGTWMEDGQLWFTGSPGVGIHPTGPQDPADSSEGKQHKEETK